ncbi:MAG: response regulator [Candidatus Omnitrophica bacterium]|nr:response regulator [Candidatus Omnitrophota bacterium]
MDEITVYGDKRRLRQILLNLVGNAVKFTHNGEVSIDIYDENEDEIKIAVGDTGIGMNQSDLDIIFERFRQADGSAKRVYEGTGLGLAITKEMVELQKGKIWVESELDKGTTFYFTVPKKPFEIDSGNSEKQKDQMETKRTDRQQMLKAVPEIEETVKVKANKGNGETILVVDDEPINIEALKVALSSHNYKTISAQDGVKGLKEMREVKPAVVVLDVMMPGMDGFEFCKMAKEDETIKDIPIILLTAKVTTADKVEGFNLGADDYIVKPFDNEELIARMQALLRRAQPGMAEQTEKKPVSKVYELKQDEEKFKKEPKGNGETILVIDDEPINIEVLDSRLKLNNYNVISAPDGVEGLQLATEKKPDLIILDLMMPRMSGYEFCKEIRKNDMLKDIPLIMLTGKDTLIDKIYGYNMGADDYMTKPVNKIDLLIRVYALLRTKALQDQLKQFTKRLSDLFGVGTTICSIFNIVDLYEIITSSAHRILGADKCAFLLFDNNPYLSVFSSIGIDQNDSKETRANIGEGISGWVAQEKKALLVPSVKNDSRFKNNDKESYYTESLLSVPFIEKDTVIGVLNIERSSEVFTKDDLQILSILANQATIAIGNAKLIDQEKKLTQRMAKAETKAEYVDILQEKNEDLEEAYEKLKSTQKQLVQSEKMATVGVLAGGVAHEINTPLGTILTNAEMLKLETTDEFQQESLNLIERSTLRCKVIVEQLLNYSRKSKEEFDFVDIKKIVEDTLILINHDLLHNCITVEQEYGNVPQVKGNANELGQVFTNILMNAIYCINETYAKESKQGKICIKIYQDGNRLITEIKDNGGGISEENKDMIFDPFFTTKDVGDGAGLGLSVSHNIIENHGGTLEVESKVGEGSTFKVILPTQEVK